jgi:hypothetical protein
MLDHKEVLLKAVEILDRGWTKGVYARDNIGLPVDYDNEAAVCWCANGAIERAAFELSGDKLRSYALSLSYLQAISVNDAAESVDEVKNYLHRLASNV